MALTTRASKVASPSLSSTSSAFHLTRCGSLPSPPPRYSSSSDAGSRLRPVAASISSSLNSSCRRMRVMRAPACTHRAAVLSDSGKVNTWDEKLKPDSSCRQRDESSRRRRAASASLREAVQDVSDGQEVVE